MDRIQKSENPSSKISLKSIN